MTPVPPEPAVSTRVVRGAVRDRHASDNGHPPYDVIVVGSGFGGSLAAHVLVLAGLRVLLLERGGWVSRGPWNGDWSVTWSDRPGYSRETPYRVRGRDAPRSLGAFHCVGGPSVFYGGVGLRMRERDFLGDDDVAPGVRWPFEYADLAPHYEVVESLLGITGGAWGEDPTDPPRRAPLPASRVPLSRTSRALRNSAVALGYRPLRLPLALHDRDGDGRPACTQCGACDGFACSIGAKNDLATVVLPALLERGLTLRPDTVVVNLETRHGRVEAVRAVDRRDGRTLRFRAAHVVVAAGALGTPHLLLASGIDRLSPAGDVIGRYLMRHCNGLVIGAAPGGLSDPGDFRKQIGIHDLYFGDPSGAGPRGKLGAIQQLRATRIAVSMLPVGGAARRALDPFLSRLIALMVLAEDQPRAENRLVVSDTEVDRFGRPQARIEHRYTRRDRAARRHLELRASEILRGAGCAITVRLPVRTFSHALGTVRMGTDPHLHPVDPAGRVRGLANLWITDGSLFPTSAAVNPSLTIAANAHRIAGRIVGGLGAAALARGSASPRPRHSPRPAVGDTVRDG